MNDGPAIRLDHVVIAVADWERSNRFYREVLGAEPVRVGNGWAYLLPDGRRLNVHGPGAGGEPVARLPVVPGGSDLCFVWPGPIRDAGAHLAARGVETELGPVPRFGAAGWGTSLYFRDPDGSLLEFISYEGS